MIGRRILLLLCLFMGWLAPWLAAAGATIELTAEEQEFLQGKVLRLGVDANRPPFEFFDERGEYIGISAGFVHALAQRLGVTVAPQKGISWPEAVEKAKIGEIDVVPKMTPTAERKKHLNFTAPYLTFPSVIVTRKDRFVEGLASLQGLKVGVVKGLVVEANLKRDFPALTLVPLADLEISLRHLSTGQVDAFVDNLGAVSYTMDKLGLTNLKIAAPTPYMHDLALGVRKDWPLLVSALDKALASMSEEEKAAIKSRWLAIQYQAGIDWWQVLLWGGPLALALLAVMAVMMVANRRLRREMARRLETDRQLQNHTRLLEARSAAKTRLAELSAALQSATSTVELSRHLFTTVAPLLKVGHGVFYQVEGDKLLFLGGYGVGEQTLTHKQVAVEDGLVGQCLSDKTPIIVTHLTQEYLPVVSGLGEGNPAMVAIYPIIHLDRVLAILELATFRPFTPDEQAFMEDLLPLLATSLAILERSCRTQQLLRESQQQAGQLAQQTMELENQKTALVHAEAWYRGIVEAAPYGLLVVDQEGIIIMANSEANAIFGYEKLEGMMVEELLLPENRQALVGKRQAYLRQAHLTTGSRLQGQVWHKQGYSFTVDVGLSPLPPIANTSACTCVSVREIANRGSNGGKCHER